MPKISSIFASYSKSILSVFPGSQCRLKMTGGSSSMHVDWIIQWSCDCKLNPLVTSTLEEAGVDSSTILHDIDDIRRNDAASLSILSKFLCAACPGR